MSLTVIGDSKQAVALAAAASVNSGEAVTILTSLTDLESGAYTVEGPIVQGTAEILVGRQSTQSDRFAICATANDIETTLTTLAEDIADRPVLLAPGSVAGALRAQRALERVGVVNRSILETTGFPFGGASRSGRTITIGATKRQIPVGGVAEDATGDLVAEYSRYMADLVPATLATSSLSNTNNMLHAPLSLVSIVRMDAGIRFSFYGDGVSPGTLELLEAADRERVALAAALGAETLTVLEWLLRFYGDQGMSGDTLAECLPWFGTSDAPATLATRYITEDVPYGIAAYARLGQELAVATPVLSSIARVLQTLAGSPMPPDTDSIHRLVHHATGTPA